VTGNNECAADNGTGTCGLSGGRDLIYRMNLPGPRQVRYETVVPGAGSQFDTVLHARRTCATPATELVCDDDDGPGLLSIIDESFDAGAHFLYVDGYTAAAAGNYELDVTVRTPDTCATAPTFTLPARGSTLRFTGSTTTATNAAGATCGGGAASPDHAFTFTVTTPTALRIETVAPASGQYDTVLHVRSACGTAGSEVACDDDAGAGLLSQIIRVFSPGTYTLFVDGYLSGASGNYAVEIEHLRGHAVLIGHDYFASNADQDRIVGNAAFLANTAGTVEILEYTQYSDNAVGGEAENTRTAIDARATALGRTVNYTTLATSGGLAAALPGKHVLLIPEQENASGAQMTAVATAWNAQLNAFIGAGGVVIVCDYSGESWRIMNGAGLFSIASSTSLGIDTPMTVVTATDPVATGVLSPYLGANGSISYPGATGGVVVSRAASGASVVRHIAR
jgi:hypothetical protein